MSTWSENFAIQAASDLESYQALTNTSLKACHRLHYLQMWLEKLCKAYLWLPAAPPNDLRFRHNIIASILPRIIAEHWRRIKFEKMPNMHAIRELCREIDLLHPQVDDNGRCPENVEYPWLDRAGNIVAPAEYNFPLALKLHQSTGKLLIKAAMALTQNPEIFILSIPKR